MSCAITIPCFNPFANVFNETCYTDIEVISSIAERNRNRRQGDPNVLSGNMSITSSSNDFEDVTSIIVNNDYFNGTNYNGSSSTDFVFLPNIIIGTVIKLSQYSLSATPAPIVLNGDYGTYLVTNITIVGITTELTLTFQSGTGSWITSTFPNPATISIISCQILTPIIPSIIQLNNPSNEVLICSDLFKPCDYINNIDFKCNPFTYPNSGIFIKDLIYWNSTNDTYTTTITNFFVGFTLKDGEDNDIVYTADCLGDICLIQKEIINENVYNFKLKILSLQCEFSKKVYKCIQEIKFGKDNRNVLKSLKLYKKALEILDKYDVRDIVGETIDYNILTYSEIKTILNKL